MRNKDFPKILIFGQVFNSRNGGGITLSNLFRGWKKDRIAVAALGHSFINISTDICDTYYQLGKEEHKWIFPFNFIQKEFPSGLLSFNTPNSLIRKSDKTGIRFFIVNKLFYPFLKFIGIFHRLSKIHLSQNLKEWLSDYRPDILYLQVSSREGILFALELINYLKIPSAIHMMDDWPSTISNKGIFKIYWKNRIENEFKQLLESVDLLLSISHAMSEEYEKKYNKKFIPFHNPIDIKHWLPHKKSEFDINKDYVKLLYSGRIGIGIKESLFEVARAINNMDTGIDIKLHIQTPTKNKVVKNKLKKFKCVIINPIVDYSELPEIYSQADILLIANDFNKKSSDFLRLSMPTKISEYMVSGTPVLVYAPKELALSEFCIKNKCGHCVVNQNKEDIINAFLLIINNKEYRETLSRNAVQLAKDLFDAEKVRNEFQQLLIKLLKKQ